MREPAILSSEGRVAVDPFVQVEPVEGVNSSRYILEHVGIERDPIVIGEAGKRIDLLVERNGPAVVADIRRHEQLRAIFPFTAAERPEAVGAIMAEGTE